MTEKRATRKCGAGPLTLVSAVTAKRLVFENTGPARMTLSAFVLPNFVAAAASICV